MAYEANKTMIIPPNPYEKNETMQLLGRQYSAELFWLNSKVREEIEQILSARPYEFSIEASSDIFMLGFIHGKRRERARRER